MPFGHYHLRMVGIVHLQSAGMSEFANHPEFFNEPVLLSKAEREYPLMVVKEFFADYRLSEIRQIREDIQEICLTTDRPPFSDPQKRADYLLFEKNLMILLEASFLLASAKKE